MADLPHIVFTESPRGYTVNGVSVPGVTTVLGLLAKPALAPWAASKTIEGIAALIVEQRLPYVSGRAEHMDRELARLTRKLRAQRIDVPEAPSRSQLVGGLAQLIKRQLKRRKLDHYSITDDSIERGKATHKALEDWINHRRIPVLGEYPDTHRGYIRGLTKFLLEWDPDFVESERPVGSAVHGFAGTRDTVCVVTRTGHGRCLLDLKTSKYVYPDSQFPQLEAYELGGVECGEPATDRRGIVRVTADGDFEVAWSVGEPEDFLSILRAYKQRKALLERYEEATRNEK